jgi:hydroxyacylglutathione hydrolase
MAKAAEIDFCDLSAPADLNVAWIHGSAAAKYNTDPDIQVHAYNEHTYILRQNKAVHYEAPFMFLLFGNSSAVLLDTGATAEPQFFPLRTTVDAIIDGWLARHKAQLQATLKAHDFQPGRYVLPQMIITPVS